MELIQRLGTDINDKYIQDCVDAITTYPGSCDGVWFSTDYGFPPISKHIESAKKIAAAAQKFRENNISVSLQLSNSIGHGQYISSQDCSGLVYEGSPIEQMVGHDGAVADYCFCWRGKNLINYIKEEVRSYMIIEPECLWIDDDFRVHSHLPVVYGCFCDNCMRTFNKENHTDFTREELVNEILYGQGDIREKYIDFVRDGLAGLMREIAKTVHKYSPKTAVGLQQIPFYAYSGIDTDFLFDVMYEETGILPKVRPGEDSYDDHNPNVFLEKAVRMEYQCVHLPDYVECLCGEIESLPFVAYGKSPAGTAFETACYFAHGLTDMSYSMMMRVTEPIQWYEKEYKLFAQRRKYWEKLSENNKKSKSAGIRYYLPEKYSLRPLSKGETFNSMNPNYNGADLLRRDAFPITFSKENNLPILLYPEIAKIISDDEICRLMELPIITDGETIEILTKRGFDFGIEAKSVFADDIQRLYEEFLPHDTTPDGFSVWASSFFTLGRKSTYTIIEKGAKTEVLGIYKNSSELKAFFSDKEKPYGIAELIITLPKGNKWAVLGYQPWKGIISHAKREQLLNIADYISGDNLPARLLTPFQMVLLPRCDENRKTVSVSLINVTIGESEKLELLVREPYGKRFFLMSDDGEKTELSAQKVSDGYLIIVPNVKPWSVATVFCEE